MSIRSINALKFFFILLFSFEMIAPALISSVSDQDVSLHTKISSNERHFTSLVSSLLCEENSGEEETESKAHKSPLTSIDLDFIETYSLLVATEYRHDSTIVDHSEGKSQPALFTLFHSYLI